MAHILKSTVAVIDIMTEDTEKAWGIMPLENLFNLDDSLADEQDAITEALGHGETYLAGGGAAPSANLVNLDHRDTPTHLPNKRVACAAYQAFCFFHGLDQRVDAQENLVRLVREQGLPASWLPINWLSAFVDAFDELED